MCQGAEEGTEGTRDDCGQGMGGGGHCGCRAYGDEDCEWLASAPAESEEAVMAAVKAGEMLKSDGRYYFVANGRTAVLRRKCDHSLVARIALAPEAAQRTRKTTLVGG